MRSSLLPLFLCASTLLPDLASGQAPRLPNETPTATDRLLVCNKSDNTVSIFDPATRKELALLPTGEGPHEVAISPDGRTAVVTDYGAQKPGRTLTVIDVLGAKVTSTIDLVREHKDGDGNPTSTGYLRPHGCLFLTPKTVLVTSERARRLVKVDIERGTIVTDFATPQTTMHMVAVGKNNWFAAATSIREGSLALFDLLSAKRKPPTIVVTGEGAEGLAIHPKTNEVWVGNRAANTVSIVDRKQAKVTATLATSAFPFRIAFTPDGKLALVSCTEGGDVMVFDVATKVQHAAISIAEDSSEQGALPMGLCVDPDGKFCYVSCGRGEFIAVLDIAGERCVDRIVAGRGPDGIGYARIRSQAK